MIYEIWAEGFRATGESGRAKYIDTVAADTLDEAVAIAVSRLPADRQKLFKRDQDGMWTEWGCRVFGSEDAARRSFG
jgi:hypothetical protein